MAKGMRSYCPRCGSLVPAGKRCSCYEREREAKRGRRLDGEPWRERYTSGYYRQSRQDALQATQGCCGVCGVQIAYQRGAEWILWPCGGIHHRIPLRHGGTDDASNLVPLCNRCHARADAEYRERHG